MFQRIRSVHFVGICGTAMASVAAAMQEKGFVVTGSDQNVYPPMSTFLVEKKIGLMSGYSEANLDHTPDLVVIGNAISRGNPEAEAVLERKMRYCSLPELLKEFFIRGKRSLVVTGTHGKTTTTSLLAWVLENSGLNPSFLIGGIPANLGQGARFTDSDWIVLEGDEYDTAFFDKRSKFVHYMPEVAIINNLEFDHADIFDNLAAVQIAFRRFVNLVPRNGLLLANGDDAQIAPLLSVNHCTIQRFGIGPSNNIIAAAPEYLPASSRFTVDGTVFDLPLVGELNVRNALAVISAARHCGLSDAQIQDAFSKFKGIRRRMEVKGACRGVTVIDDFGHHPTAIRETLIALRHKFPGQRVMAIFEPRSNTTRRNVFQVELATALLQADSAVVAEVARLDQLPPELRLDPTKLMADLRSSGKPAEYLPSVDSIVEYVAKEARPNDVVCVFSNGGFDGIHSKLLARLGA